MRLSLILFSIVLSTFSYATADIRSPGDCDFLGALSGHEISLTQCGKIGAGGGSFMANEMSSKMADILCTGTHCNPKELDAVKNLTSLLNPAAYQNTNDVGASNRGLRKYFKNETRAHSCFGELAFHFYQNVDLQGTGGSDLNTPSQNGKAWDAALKTAGGNPNLAMELIGACGHDDDGSSHVERYLSFCGDQPRLLDVLKKEGGQCFVDTGSTPFTAVQFICPMKGSSFFMPDGLPGTSPSAAIKGELANDYWPGKAPAEAFEQIPHKTYHVYGAAYLTCHMIQEGVPKEKARAIERETSIIYRAVRVCNAAQKNTANFNSLLEQIDRPTIDFSAAPQEVLSQWNESAAAVEKFLLKQLGSNQMEVFGRIGLGMRDNVDLTPEDRMVFEAKIHSYSGTVLAGFLTSSDRESSNAEEEISRLQPDFGSDAKGFSETLKKLRSQTNSFFLKVAGKFAGKVNSGKIKSITEDLPCVSNAAINFATRHEYRCDGFAGCETAKKKLLTYRADFIESSEYHRLGDEFAAQHCSPVKDPNETLDQAACSALKLQNVTVTKNPNGPKTKSGSAQ